MPGTSDPYRSVSGPTASAGADLLGVGGSSRSLSASHVVDDEEDAVTGGWGGGGGAGSKVQQQQPDSRTSYLFSQPGERATRQEEDESYHYRPPAFGNNNNGNGYSQGAGDYSSRSASASQQQAFAPRAFNSHNPSSLLPSRSTGGLQDDEGAAQTSPSSAPAGAAAAPRQLAPGYPMPQGLGPAPTGYSPFARVDSLSSRREAPEDMYGVPENFLEVEVRNPMTHGESHVPASVLQASSP